ncbi:hypothetical protein ACQPX6_06415 [Actinomycetospora sp. CA-101289]|uniref:hypothetical protein n=1 Tax=Actinomycetospora sp. CA-101289 TaxID=3239893 RepID=UPI003D987A65
MWQLVLSSVVIACGIGLSYGAMPSLIMAAVPIAQTAAANSLNNLMRALGTSFASAIAGVLLASLVTSAGVPTEGAFVLVMLLGAGAAVLALGIVACIPLPPGPAPLVRGVVRHRDGPAAGALLTVVSTDGHQLGAGRAGDDGAYALARTGPGRPHLLVVRWSGTSQAEPLTGVDGLVRDIALVDRVPVRTPS